MTCHGLLLKHVACLDGMEPQEQVEAVARSFSEVFCQYSPVDLSKLPSYLPAEEAPQLQVYHVWNKMDAPFLFEHRTCEWRKSFYFVCVLRVQIIQIFSRFASTPR